MFEAPNSAVAALDGAVEELLGVDLSRLGGAEVAELLVALERVRCRLWAADARVVAEAQSRALAGEYARQTSLDLLVELLRVTPAEARARITRACDVTPRQALSGEPLPAVLPAAAAALADGSVSPAHVVVITGAVDAVPVGLSPVAHEVVESTLVEAAHHEHPGQLRRTAALLLARLDPDGPEPVDDLVERSREVTLTRHADGSGRLRGRLTPEAVVVWDTVFDALSAPVPSEEGVPDPRSAGQRRHDGLLEAGQRLLRSGSLPAAGGVPVTILIRTTAADLAAANGVCLTSRGDLLRTREVLAMAGEAEFVPVVLDEGGAVLNLGRSQRLAGRAQRLVLAARDGGCCFPGCDRPAAWTEVHHVIEWRNGGATDLDNLCLLCRYHHRTFERSGWTIQMTNGMPEWIPPPWIDPAQRPRRNHAHHPPDIDFDIGRTTAA